MNRLLLALPLVLAAGCADARRSEPLRNAPLAFSPAAERGEILFAAHCSECHPRGAGGLGPSLNDKPLPEFLMKIQVRTGLGAMPSFSDKKISDEELDDIMEYIKEMRDVEE